MAQTVMVLGASVYHLDLIRAARALGCRVLSVDPDAAAPGHNRSDRAIALNTFDAPALLEIIREEKVEGVVSATGSPEFLAACFLAEGIGRRAVPSEVADILSNRGKFRDFLTELGLPHPQTHVLSKGKQIPPEILDSNRWVLKPGQGSGSRGVFRISSAKQFNELYPVTMACSGSEPAMLEGDLDGRSAIAQAILRGGKIEAIWVADRFLPEAPHTPTASLRIPSQTTQFVRKTLTGLLERVFAALRITDCLFHCDFIAVDNRVYLLGIAPTLGGYGLPALLRAATGVDLAQYAVLEALGQAPQIPQVKEAKATAAVLLHVNNAGRLQFDAKQAEALADIKWISGISWDRPLGSRVAPYSCAELRVGTFLVHGVDRDQLDARVSEILRRLQLEAK